MKIYILDEDTAKCAQALDDKSLNSMIKDIAQVLCHARCIYQSFGEYGEGYSIEWKNNPPLSAKNINDEWSQWVRECKANYLYLVELGCECILEYQFRFIKDCWEIDAKNLFKYSQAIHWANNNVPDFPLYKYDGAEWESDAAPLTPFPLVMPKKYKIGDWYLNNPERNTNETINCIIDSYRNYYQAKLIKSYYSPLKKEIKWTRREKPKWLKI